MTHPLETTTGAELRKARWSVNLNQTDMAEYLGVQQPFIAGLESGSEHPNDSHLRDWCRGVDLNRCDAGMCCFRVAGRERSGRTVDRLLVQANTILRDGNEVWIFEPGE